VAQVVVRMDEDAATAGGSASVVRLRRDAEGDDSSIFRYDRPGLLAAVARLAGGR